MMSPVLPDEKSKKEPFSSLTKKEGLFSLVKGDRPTYSRPWRRSFTVRPITSEGRSRALISSRKRSSKRIALLERLRMRHSRSHPLRHIHNQPCGTFRWVGPGDRSIRCMITTPSFGPAGWLRGRARAIRK